MFLVDTIPHDNMYTVSDGHSPGSPPHGSDSDSGDRILRRLSKDSEAMLQRRSARRGRKQDAERKRRERLNTSMIALKQLVCKETHTEDASNTDDSKLEKAQILEATVEYVRQKQQEEEQQPRPTQLYTMGFNTAAQLTLEFLSECDQELSQKLHCGLRDYLSRKAKELQESGPEGEKRQAKDAPGKCRSPILRHCREARHKPTQASGRGERQREEPLAQTPSPSPSPRLEPLRSVSSNRQCFASLPGTPTMVWGSGMYPSVAINSSVMYPSPSSSPLPRYLTPEGLTPTLGTPIASTTLGPQGWPRSAGDGLHASVAAPYCRLNTSHNDSGYFSPSIAATSPYSIINGRGYLHNGRVLAALPTAGVLNLSNSGHTAGTPSTTPLSARVQSQSGQCLPVPDSGSHGAAAAVPFRARADSSTHSPVASPTGSRVEVTSPPGVRNEGSRGSEGPDQPMSPEDREIASILTGAEKPSIRHSLSNSPAPSSPAPSSHHSPAPAPAPAPVAVARHPAAPRVAAPAGVEPKTTWRPW